jgi:hypothetical protein
VDAEKEPHTDTTVFSTKEGVMYVKARTTRNDTTRNRMNVGLFNGFVICFMLYGRVIRFFHAYYIQEIKILGDSLVKK